MLPTQTDALPKPDHSRFRHFMRGTASNTFIAVFKYTDITPVPEEVMAAYQNLVCAISECSADIATIEAWGGRVAIYKPTIKEHHHDTGEETQAECRDAVLAAIPKAVILGTWANASNEGHGVSVLFSIPDAE